MNASRISRLSTLSFVHFGFYLAIAVCNSQQAIGQTDLKIPTARQVIERYVEALGGEMELRSVQTVRVKCQSEAMFDASDEITLIWKNGQSKMTRIFHNSDSATTMLSGFDGEFEWRKYEENPGYKQKTRRFSLLDLEDYGVVPYALELLEFDGRIIHNGLKLPPGTFPVHFDVFDAARLYLESTWHLTFEYKNGQKHHRYFSIVSGLLVYRNIDYLKIKRRRPAAGALGGGGFGGGGGRKPVRYDWSEKQKDGLLHLKGSTIMPFDWEPFRQPIDSIELDVELEDSLFAIPDSVDLHEQDK